MTAAIADGLKLRAEAGSCGGADRRAFPRYWLKYELVAAMAAALAASVELYICEADAMAAAAAPWLCEANRDSALPGNSEGLRPDC
ncbi:hypothetical protein BpHYR1_046344 [Brachionus plicatilis]|uniref:Uncharacterized protein n=1 Tax=Brachionus plicatilis TaxID=10195 RepID=A0A3M7PIH5_BRAPC|nr:hypothetical protein BpHYR1_046344 [Brachionus plicatilis]